jgi:rare lipoprotein A
LLKNERKYKPMLILKKTILSLTVALALMGWAQAEEIGVCSWYSENDPGINKYTANGEVFNDEAMTCAKWDVPFGTWFKITNIANGKFVLARTNDRGPARRLNRIIDLTKEAFSKIADTKLGLITVKLEVIK